MSYAIKPTRKHHAGERLVQAIIACLLLLPGFSVFADTSAQDINAHTVISRIGQGDFKKGAAHLFDLIESENTSAMFIISNLALEVGESRIARQLLQDAAERGNLIAIKTLASGYRTGWIGETNLSKSRNWYEEASLYHNKDAIKQLGIFYRDGLDVDKDAIMAYRWFLIAQALGAEGIAPLVQDLEKQLRPSEIQAAKQQADDWLQQNPAKTFESPPIPKLP